MTLPPTYNPILESSPVARMRWLAPLRAPEPYAALVLVPAFGDLVTIRHGEPVPDARQGTYRHRYLVDISEHRLVLDIPLLSKDASFAFRSRVSLACRVVDPAEVVRRRIDDMSESIYDPLKRKLGQVAKEFDISRFHEAHSALNQEMRSLSGDIAIRLEDIYVELLVDDDEIAKSGRAYRDVERDGRLADHARDRVLENLRRDGAESLLAEMYLREGPRAVLEAIEGVDGAERKELLNVYATVLNRTDPDREPFDFIETERRLVELLSKGSSAPFGGVRSSRVRGTAPATPRGLTASGRESPSPVLPEHVVSERTDTVPTAPPEDEPPGPAPERAPAPKSSRVRGTQAG